jgi:hypothetical protein
MKNVLYIFSLLSLFLVSCEKEIDIDLNEADQKVVIVGSVNNLDEPATVRITRSMAFDQPNDFPAVSNGTVEITRFFGTEEEIFILTEVQPGVYQTENPIGQQGANFKLLVVVDGETYEAECVMPDQTEIVDFYFEEILPGSLNPGVGFVDVGGRKDFYKANIIINRKRRPDIFITDDTFTDGEIMAAIFGGPDLEFETGDTVRIEIDHIDEKVYNYWFSLSQNVNDATAAPANPVTNLSNGALGYFSAFSRSSVEGIVP